MSEQTVADKPKIGRPPMTPEMPVICELVDAYEGAGTITDIADHIGVDRRQVYRWLDGSPEFVAAVKSASQRATYAVERNLWAMTKRNVVACIFWLKNRDPDNWRDRIEHEVTTQRVQIVFNIGTQRQEIATPARRLDEGDVVDVESKEVGDDERNI